MKKIQDTAAKLLKIHIRNQFLPEQETLTLLYTFCLPMQLDQCSNPQNLLPVQDQIEKHKL